jgi:hypothetical protein
MDRLILPKLITKKILRQIFCYEDGKMSSRYRLRKKIMDVDFITNKLGLTIAEYNKRFIFNPTESKIIIEHVQLTDDDMDF